jgi:hypothetical protein
MSRTHAKLELMDGWQVWLGCAILAGGWRGDAHWPPVGVWVDGGRQRS